MSKVDKVFESIFKKLKQFSSSELDEKLTQNELTSGPSAA